MYTKKTFIQYANCLLNERYMCGQLEFYKITFKYTTDCRNLILLRKKTRNIQL